MINQFDSQNILKTFQKSFRKFLDCATAIQASEGRRRPVDHKEVACCTKDTIVVLIDSSQFVRFH